MVLLSGTVWGYLFRKENNQMTRIAEGKEPVFLAGSFLFYAEDWEISFLEMRMFTKITKKW